MNRSDGADPSEILSAVNADIKGDWVLERSLGGSNEGAFLVRSGESARAVLKWHSAEAADLDGAAEFVQAARNRGWPTPTWYGVGRAPTGQVWLLQEFIEGSRPATLDRRTADQMIEILEVQVALLPAGSGGWAEWVAGVMFEDVERLRGRIRPLPGGESVIARVDAIAEAFAGRPLRSCDLVHGDFSLSNILATADGLRVIDVADLGPGPMAYDLAKTLVVAITLDHATESALSRLWSFAESLDQAEFALCAAACALKTAESIVRHGYFARAPISLSRKVKFLDRVRDLVSF